MRQHRRSAKQLCSRTWGPPPSFERLESRYLLATASLLPAHDNSLFENAQGSLSNGAGEYLFVGRTGQPAGAALRRALLEFDIAGQIPAGATIRSAALTMSMTKTVSGPQDIGLHRVLAAWGEGTSDAEDDEGRGTQASAGDATWIHRLFDATPWQTHGGDFTPAASATTEVDDVGDYVWSSPQMVEDLQNWLQHPEQDFGWLLIGDESTRFAAKQFGSRENPDTELRPQLTVEYDLPQAAAPWQNAQLAEDVTGDGVVSPLDALLVLNVLNGAGGGLEQGPLPNPPQPPRAPPPYVDVDGDNSVLLADALLVIAYLNEAES